MSVWACRYVTNGMQLHTFEMLFEDRTGLCARSPPVVHRTNVLQANRMSNEEHVGGRGRGCTILGAFAGVRDWGGGCGM